jgi:hypothetical protein
MEVNNIYQKDDSKFLTDNIFFFDTTTITHLNATEEKTKTKKKQIKLYIELCQLIGDILGTKEEIKITPFGLEKSNKEKNQIFFGPNRMSLYLNESVNDYILNLDENKPLEDEYNSIFQIKFNEHFKIFELIPESLLSKNYLIFIKIQNKYKIEKNTIISIGEITLTIEINEKLF